LAEHIGFEPMEDIFAFVGLANRCFRPLSQCSLNIAQTQNCAFDWVLSCVTVSINYTKYWLNRQGSNLRPSDYG